MSHIERFQRAFYVTNKRVHVDVRIIHIKLDRKLFDITKYIEEALSNYECLMSF